MNNPLIIAFGFEARSGKGECVSTIYNKHAIENGGDYNIFRISFAGKLREEIREAMDRHWKYHFGEKPRVNWDDHQLAMKFVCEWAHVPYDPNPPVDETNPFGKQRPLQQWWGTEYRRSQNESYWLDYVVDQVRIADSEVVLIDDLRYPNEFEWADEHGITVKTTRIGNKPITNGIPGHVSENAIADRAFAYNIVAGDGQLPWLKQQALNLFDWITKEQALAL